MQKVTMARKEYDKYMERYCWSVSVFRPPCDYCGCSSDDATVWNGYRVCSHCGAELRRLAHKIVDPYTGISSELVVNG